MAELKPCPNPECRGECVVQHEDLTDTPWGMMRNYWVECNRDGGEHSCLYRGPVGDNPSQASARHNALPREERWVPVSEGLPADRTEVDVYQKTPLREAGHFIRKIRVGLLYESQTFRTPGGRYQVVPFITHWRPHTPPRGPEGG